MFEPPLYRSIFSRSPIATCILSPSTEPVILDVNEAFVRTVGHMREQLVGMPLFTAFPADPNDAADTGVNALRNSLAQVIATGEPHALATQRYPIRTMSPEGCEQFAERFWDATNTPVFDDDQQLVCIVHVTIDVTEQKRAEEALRLSRQQAMEAAHEAEAERARLDAVLQSVSVGIMMADADGTLLQFNPEHARLWGRREAPDGGKLSFAEWRGWWADGGERHGQRVKSEEWPLVRALAGESTSHQLIEIESFQAPYERRIALASAAPIRDSAGKVVAGVTALMDLTERLKAEAALREADRRKDEFLAMLAHELRNPLAPILAAASLLGHGILDPERVRQASTIISRQVRHMTGLVDDLLDVSRVTRGQIVLERTRVDVRRVVSEAVEQVLPLVEARRHTLSVRTPPEPVLVCGDSKRLVQVLANLLNNAAKYTPEGGRIALDTVYEEEHVRISVTDNGIGMPPELIARAFELFSQAERGADRSQGGLGIGLALVKSLVELHGGHVAAHSNARDCGSRFTVCLPRIEAETVEARSSPRGMQQLAAELQLHVMVVDDNQDAANMLAMMIETMGHRPSVAHDPFSALRMAKAEPADVYVLDIGLPDMDGNELARRLRADPVTGGARLIALTGYGRDEDRQAAFAAGFDHHFVKPVNPYALGTLLREVANGWHVEPVE